MIAKTTAYTTSDNTVCSTIEEAQQHELELLIVQGLSANGVVGFSADEVANYLIANRDKVLDILTTSKTSRPTARKINRKKKPAAAAMPPVVVTVDGKPVVE